MFSKLVKSKVLFKNVAEKASLVNVRQFKAVPPQTFKTTTAELAGGDEDLAKNLANWEYASSLFYGPNRDHKNFPTLKMPETHPPVKLGFAPATWFDNLYTKTGVTGPYLFGLGSVVFLFSKEIVILEHQFAHFYTFWLTVMVVRWKVGAKLANWLSETGQKYNNRMFFEPERVAKENVQSNITGMEEVIKYEDANKYIFDAKKENVDLQLESTYRQRLAEVHQAVKRRLDYHVEVENVQKRAEQQNMVDWIHRNVVQSITPQQEKDTLSKCLSDLKGLAAKQTASA